MGNRTLLVIWLAALLGVGGYIYYVYGSKGGESPLPSLGSLAGSLPIVGGAAPSTDLVGTLNSKSMVALSIRPTGFEPMSKFAREFLTRLKGTQMAQKSGVAIQIDAALEKGFLSLAETSATDEESARAIRIAGQVWGDLTEILVVLSKEKVREDLPVPVVGAAAKFNTKESASKFRTFVDKGILLGKPSIKEAEFSFTKSAVDGEYGFEIYPKDLPGSLEGSVKFDGDTLRVIVGSKDVKYFDGSGEDLFVKSKSFEGLLSASKAAPAYLIYVDAKPLSEYAKSLSPLMQAQANPMGEPAGEPDPVAQALQYLDNMAGAAVVGSFNNGFVSEACVRGDLAKLNVQNLAKVRTSADVFPFLIGNTTVLAIRFGAPLMKYAIETQLKSLPPEMAQSFQPALKFIDDIGAEEFGIVLNAPAGSPIPEGAFYISTKDGTNLLQRFKSGVEGLATQMGMPLPVSFTDSTSQKGRPLLQVMNPSGMPVVGGVVGGSTLMFGLSEDSLTKVEDNMTKGESELQKFTLVSGEPFPSIQGVNGVYLVNLAPAMDTVRGFAPMLLAQQGPGMMDQDPKDVDEVLDILAGTAVVMHGTALKGSDVFCQTTGAARLKGKS